MVFAGRYGLFTEANRRNPVLIACYLLFYYTYLLAGYFFLQ